MRGLTNLQNEFQQYLLHSDDRIHHNIVGTEKVPVITRLSIYRHAYYARLREALASNYPVLQLYIGNDDFEKLAQAYIDQYPSPYRSIRWFGDRLPQLLNDYSPSYLSELAQFEWAMTLSFDAADRSVVSLEEMATIAPEAWTMMRLQAHPSVQRLNLKWNVVEIWEAIIQNQTPPELQQHSQPVHWVLWRKEFIHQFCSLGDDEAWAMDTMRNGLTFGEMCEGLCEWVDEQNAGMRAAILLKSWITSGLMSKIKI